MGSIATPAQPSPIAPRRVEDPTGYGGRLRSGPPLDVHPDAVTERGCRRSWSATRRHTAGGSPARRTPRSRARASGARRWAMKVIRRLTYRPMIGPCTNTGWRFALCKVGLPTARQQPSDLRQQRVVGSLVMLLVGRPGVECWQPVGASSSCRVRCRCTVFARCMHYYEWYLSSG